MRRLHGHLPRSPADLLEEAAAWCRSTGAELDVYGTGAVLTDLEARVAGLLGFPAATRRMFKENLRGLKKLAERSV